MARREWKKGEEMYMACMYLRQPAEKTAKVLNRSKPSIYAKAREMGISYEYISKQLLAECFNCDTSVVTRWIDKKGLACIKMPYKFGYYYYISAETFWKWAYKHKKEINWSKYEIGSILPEPEWVKEEKKSHQMNNLNKRITDMDIIQVKNMLRKGMTRKQIGLELGRSEESVSYINQKYIKHSKR